MKKILMAVFAVLMLAAWVAPSMADTTFYGTYRVRLFNIANDRDFSDDRVGKTYTGTGTNTQNEADGAAEDNDNNAWIDQRFRLGVESKASDNLRGFVQLEIGDNDLNRSDIWGTGGDAANGVSNLSVSARQAYLSFNAGPVRIKAGRQVFGDAPDGGQSFRVSDDGGYYGLWDGGLVLVSVVDGVVFTTKAVDPLTLNFGYVKFAEGSTTGSGERIVGNTNANKDHDIYLLQATAAPMDTVKGGAYFVYSRDASTTPATAIRDNQWWLGAGVEAKLDPINLKVHAAYKGGKFEKGCDPAGTTYTTTVDTCVGVTTAEDVKYAAYAIDADASINIDQLTVGASVGMGSGDDDATDKEDKSFNDIVGAYGVQLGQRPAIFFDNGEVSNGGASLLTTYAQGGANTIGGGTLDNITFAQLYASFKATDELSVSGLVAGFWYTENKDISSTTNTNEWESAIGTEVDLVAVYKLYKELALTAQAAWFLPGEGIRTYKSTAGNHAATSIATDDMVSEYFAKVQYDF